MGEASVAIFWATPHFKERASVSSGFSMVETLTSASAVPHCGGVGRGGGGGGATFQPSVPKVSGRRRGRVASRIDLLLDTRPGKPRSHRMWARIVLYCSAHHSWRRIRPRRKLCKRYCHQRDLPPVGVSGFIIWILKIGAGTVYKKGDLLNLKTVVATSNIERCCCCFHLAHSVAFSPTGHWNTGKSCLRGLQWT